MNPFGRKVFGSVLAAGMAAACYWSLRLSYADHLAQTDSPSRVWEALRLVPSSASYWLHWADLEEAGGRPGTAGFAQAAQADPYNATVWIRAGLDAEMNGDFTRAEKHLLLAAQRSRQFEPRWTLANYYFRRGDADHFWPWAKSAMQWAYTDRDLLFELCWKMQPNPEVILDRAIPDDPDVLRAYLGFLIADNYVDASLAVARRLEAVASNVDRTLLLRFADWMLAHQRLEDALTAWNSLCIRRIIPYGTIDAGAGRFLTNGGLAANPLNAGFDWRTPRIQGINTVYSGSPSWVRFDFSGEQPQWCRFFYQFVPMAPGQRYSLQYAYRTQDIRPDSGLRWRITDAASDKEIAIEHTSLSSDGWTKGSFEFVTPAGVQIGRITLGYGRQPGTVRIAGSVWLREVGLERLP